MAYPTGVDVDADIGGGTIPDGADPTNSPSHSLIHRLLGNAVQEVQSKLGTGASTAANGKVLAGTGATSSEWTATPSGLTSVTATTFTGALVGNASTASSAAALTAAVDIGGVSFDGSGSINLPGVNTAGTQDTSGTAAIATTITVEDESVDTVSYPVFVKTATGDKEPKTGSNLKFNSATGALTATSFVGALTGNATTATALDGTTMTGMTVVESDVFEADTDGSAAAPAFTWDSDPSMGLYRAAADCLAVGLNGETAFIATESTNNDNGSSGDGLVGISDYCGGIAGGSAARMITQDIEGIQVKRLAFDSSSREFKSDEAAWGLTDEQFMSIQPTAFTPNGQYVHEGVHYMIGTDGNGEQTVPPEGSLPIRRAGMIQEDVALVDLHLISEAAIDWQAIATATLEKVQRLMERVEALEAV